MEASTILNSPASGLSVKSQVSARAGIFSKPCASLFGSQRQSCSISFGRRNTLEPVKVAAEEVLEFSDTVDDEEDIKESRIVLYLKVDGFASSTLASELIEELLKQEGVLDAKYKIIESVATIYVTRETTSLAPLSGASLLSVILNKGFQITNVTVGFDDEAEEDLEYFNFDSVVREKPWEERFTRPQ